MNWNRFVKTIGTLTVAAYLIVVLTPITNVAGCAFVIDSDLRPADAIVVLGSGLTLDGNLSDESTQRFLWGLMLYKKGLSPLLVLSGPSRPGSAPESTVRRGVALELGIPDAVILEMSDVHTTRDEARQAALLLKPRNLNHVLLVTESLHMRRSKMVFEAAGFRVSAAPSDNLSNNAGGTLDRLQLLYGLWVHSAGIVYYRLAGYL